jgi:hypothetical protein
MVDLVSQLHEVFLFLHQSENAAQVFGKGNERDTVFSFDCVLAIVQDLQKRQLDACYVFMHIF